MKLRLFWFFIITIVVLSERRSTRLGKDEGPCLWIKLFLWTNHIGMSAEIHRISITGPFAPSAA